MKMTPEKRVIAEAMRSRGDTYKSIGAVVGMVGSSVRYNLDQAAKVRILERNAGCRDEKAAYDADYNAKNRDKRAEYVKQNKERIVIRDAAYRAEHRGEKTSYDAEYRLHNREKLAPYHAAYRAEHRKEAIVYQREYRAKNKEALKVARKAYHEKHTSEDAARSAIRRALKAGSLIGATAAQKAEIKEIYRRAKEDRNVRCYLCGSIIALGDRHVDHIMPLSRGGQHRPSNLAVACSKCNMKKRDKLPEEIGLLL